MKSSREIALRNQAERIAHRLGCDDLDMLLHERGQDDKRLYRDEQGTLLLLMMALDHRDSEIMALFRSLDYYIGHDALHKLFTRALSLYREPYYKHLFQAIYDAIRRTDDEPAGSIAATPRPAPQGDQGAVGMAAQEHPAPGLPRQGVRPQQHAAEPPHRAAPHQQYPSRPAAARR